MNVQNEQIEKYFEQAIETFLYRSVATVVIFQLSEDRDANVVPRFLSV